MGIERLMLLMENQALPFPEDTKCELYIATMGEKATIQAAAMANALRREGMFVEFDVVGRSVKAQMKYANKLGAEYVIVIGDNEIQENSAKLKCMESGEETDITLGADFIKAFYDKKLANACENVLSALKG